MSETTIEWTDATWNPTRGCSRVSEGCRNCYAERMARRFMGPGQPFEGFAKVVAPRDSLDRVGGRRNGWTGRVELIPSKLDEPLHWRTPRRVFVNSMSDLFHEALPDEAIDQVFAVMALAPRHTFQILTKRPQRMREWFAGPAKEDVEEIAAFQAHRWGADAEAEALGGGWFPGQYDHAGRCELAPCFEELRIQWPLPNVWLGVSVEDQATADERLPLLLQTPAAVRFVSYEPALGPVDFAPWLWQGKVPLHTLATSLKNIGPSPLDWIIVGGESGPGARPFDVAWARSIVAQCREASVPCFVKQLGALPVVSAAEWNRHPRLWKRAGLRADGTYHPQLKSPKGGDPSEWPEDLRVREFPGGGGE